MKAVNLEDHYGPLVTRLMRQVDRWTQQLHWYLLIDLITVRWSAAHRGLPVSLITNSSEQVLVLEGGGMHPLIYRVCGLAFTAGIAVKFGTAHGRSRPAVGSAKCIGSYGRKGVPPAPCILCTSQQKIITPTELLRPIYNFYSLTICS